MEHWGEKNSHFLRRIDESSWVFLGPDKHPSNFLMAPTLGPTWILWDPVFQAPYCLKPHHWTNPRVQCWLHQSMGQEHVDQEKHRVADISQRCHPDTCLC